MPASVQVAIVFSLVLWAGCASRTQCYPTSTTVLKTSLCECGPTDRKPLVPDLSLVPPANSPRTGLFCALAEQDVQCQAAQAAPIANLLAKESESLNSSGLLACHVDTPLLREVLALNAMHQRNLAAGSALEVFLRLVEAEAGAQNLEQQLEEIARMLGDIEQLTQRGLLPPVPQSEVHDQRLQLLHRQIELQATIEKLNQQLAELLECELPSNSHFWPEAHLHIEPNVPDSEEATMLALANRADVAALRLATQADAGTAAELVQRLLPQSSPGSGDSMPLAVRLAVFCKSRDSGVRGDQLALAASTRERQTRNETFQAVSALSARLAQIDLTRQRLAIARAHTQSVEQQIGLASGSLFTLRKARIAVLVVEQALMHDVIEWKISQVKLKQSQGLLAIECGYDLHRTCVVE